MNPPPMILCEVDDPIATITLNRPVIDRERGLGDALRERQRRFG